MMGHQYIPEECLAEAQAYADFYAGKSKARPNLYEKRISSYGFLSDSNQERRRSESPSAVESTTAFDESLLKIRDDEDMDAYLDRVTIYADKITHSFSPNTCALEYMLSSPCEEPCPPCTFESLDMISSTGISEDIRSLAVSPRKPRSFKLKKTKGKKKIQKSSCILQYQKSPKRYNQANQVFYDYLLPNDA